MQNSEKTNEWINWIEEAIDKKHIKNYEYENFKNIQEIGSGAFGKVFRANWKSFDHYLALKSFYDLNKITLKEIVNEINLQRDVDFHNNIIRFYGITKHASENIFNPTKDYLLVMEYADGGTLRDYLKNNFHRLTWNDKYNLASQLARSILCLHEEGIIHRDLHSCNVLVHQDSIKLADFCLSKRIGEASKSQTKLLGMVSYIDPKVLTDNNLKSNEKSDIYSIGVLLWEISSGKPPFHEENYDFSLMYKISQGRREEIISGTPDDYSNLYTECWNGELNNRPTIHEVVDRLKNFTPRSKRRRYEYLTPDSLENSLHEDLSQMIHDFDNKNSDEINNMTSTNKINENILSEKDLIMIINEINDLILEKLKKGDATKNYKGDGVEEDHKKAFELYKKSAEGEYLDDPSKVTFFDFGKTTTEILENTRYKFTLPPEILVRNSETTRRAKRNRKKGIKKAPRRQNPWIIYRRDKDANRIFLD
ncbi:kinase-like domain-containing protein [Rhizophagus irregularis DAOM 181602=DAOM 197198]|nr:kinase-like domain-containing protein [Rhizophagus irregularis DAOM 181602=DAOM 197198]